MPPDPSLVQTAIQAAQAYGIPPDLFVAQINAESGFNPQAYNPAGPSGGAKGIAQFIDPTAAQYGVNPYDPTSALWGAAAYDADLKKQTGSWVGAMNSYGTTVGGNAPQVAQIAAGIDANGGASPTMAAGFPLAGAGPGASATGGTPQYSCFGGSGITAFILDLFVRLLLGLLGVFLIYEGIRMLAGQESVTVQVVNQAGRKLRSKGA